MTTYGGRPTANAELLGYAFRCIDGTGIVVDRSQGTLIQGTTIVEEHLRPTPELKAEHRLGTFTKKNAKRGQLISQDVGCRVRQQLASGLGADRHRADAERHDTDSGEPD